MKPMPFDIRDLTRVLSAFPDESDRGVAVLAGSFVENALGARLVFQIAGKRGLEATLFGPVGALSTFANRIDIIDESIKTELALIKDVRNHFAHHPMDTTFSTPAVQKMVSKLRRYGTRPDLQASKIKCRMVYLETCATVSNVVTLPMRAAPSRHDLGTDRSGSHPL